MLAHTSRVSPFSVAETAGERRSSVAVSECRVNPAGSGALSGRDNDGLQSSDSEIIGTGIEELTSQSSPAFTGNLPMVPRIRGQNTLEVLTGWLDLAFYRLGIPKSFKTSFGIGGEQQSLVSQMPLSFELPEMPAVNDSRVLVQCYFDITNVIFPVLDAAKFDSIQDQIGDPASCIRTGKLGSLLLLYLVIAIGSFDTKNSLSANLTSCYLTFCQSAIGHVMTWVSLEAVQIAFLFSLCLKRHDKIAAAWHTLGICVSMAQSLGINRKKSSHHPHINIDRTATIIEKRLWWAIYSYEKIFAFEVGRASIINDAHCNQEEPQHDSAYSRSGGVGDPDFFGIVISYAKLLSEISGRAIKSTLREEGASREGLENIVVEKVRATRETVQSLIEWADGLPEGLKPRSDLMCSPRMYPFAAFISAQYHNAMITLTRNSLLISEEAIRNAMEISSREQDPWDYVIHNGPSMAVNSARGIIKLLIDGVDQGLQPCLSALHAPLQALYIIAIYLIIHPNSRLRASDLNLMYNAGDFAKLHYEGLKNDSKLHSILVMLNDHVLQPINAAQRNEMRGQASTRPDGEVAQPWGSYSRHNDAGQTGNTPQFSPMVVHERAFTSQQLAATNQEVNSLSSALSENNCSPWIDDDIGWDWSSFSQLATTSFGYSN
ncbi:hypothetical protein ACMFMG_011747 [Clarireedia jacksonii]